MADKSEWKTPSMGSEGKGDGHQYGRKPRTPEPIPIAGNSPSEEEIGHWTPTGIAPTDYDDELLFVCSYTLSTWRWSCAGENGASCHANSTLVQSFSLTSTVSFLQVPATPQPELTRLVLLRLNSSCIVS